MVSCADLPRLRARYGWPRPPTPRRARRDPWGHVAGRLLRPVVAAWREDRTSRYVPRVQHLLDLPPSVAARRTLLRLRALLLHAEATVPFWRRRMREAGFDPRGMRDVSGLAALPPLTRDEVGRNLADLVATPCRRRPLADIRSGGTTSDPLPFVQLREALWWKAATARVLRRRMGWHRGDRVAYLWGAAVDRPRPPDGGLARWKYDAQQRLVERALWLPASDLSPEALDRHADTLARFRPAVLQGYPTATDLLARRLLERGRRLEVPFVLLTAETVFPAQRRRIAEALGAEVLSFYGAREVGWIAAECRAARRLHLNTPGVHVEVEPDGRLLLTDLVDPAAPLFRYEVGDRGALAGAPCPCGDPRPVLAELHGRVIDVLVLPSGMRVPGVVLDPRNWMMDQGILEQQIVQTAPDRATVRWVASAGFEPGQLDAWRTFLDDRLQGEVDLTFERVERIEPEPNGKVRVVISLVGREA